MFLADVKHQATAQRHLQRAMARDRVHHAFVFHGPDGVGKELTALGLARVLLCEGPIKRELTGGDAAEVGLERLLEACGACPACRAAAAGVHPDLHLIYRQLNRQHPDQEVRKRKALDIGVDVLRHFVIASIGLTAAMGRRKVYLFREADRMKDTAQNVLLKTLEEPPGDAVLILLVSAMDRLLPTTLSRCQVVRFAALPAAFIRDRLLQSREDLPADQADWYAHSAQGSLGRAIEHAEDRLFEVNQRLLGGLTALTGGDAETPVRVGELNRTWVDEAKSLGERHRKRDPEISDTEATRRGIATIFLLGSNWFADVLRTRSGAESAVGNVSHLPALKAAAVDPQAAIDAVNRLAQAQRQLDLNVNTQLCVEVVTDGLARLCLHTPTSAT